MGADLQEAVRSTWRTLAPHATWRGRSTGWNALDLLTLAEVVHQSTPAMVVVAGGIGAGGLPLFLADCMDDNKKGRVVAGEAMSVERRRSMPEHRRVQWVSSDLLVADMVTARRLSNGAIPVLVVANPACFRDLEGVEALVTAGSYLVVAGDVALEAERFPSPRFLVDPGRDPAGLSACAWLLRVPS